MVRDTRRVKENKRCWDPEVLLLRSKSHLGLILLGKHDPTSQQQADQSNLCFSGRLIETQVNLSRWGPGGLTIHEVQDEAELVRSVEGICHTHDEGAVLQRGRHRVRAAWVLWSPAQWSYFLLFVTWKPLSNIFH